MLCRAIVIALLLFGRHAWASPCRSADIRFKPSGNLQIAVWVEDAQGNYIDTVYITRQTGYFGLANRPGSPQLKTAVRYPYGRRDMVLPVWAHHRNHSYRLVVMGGAKGNSVANCAAHGLSCGAGCCGGPCQCQDHDTDCDDTTIACHADVSSPEPFYCSPNGGQESVQNGVDVVSCASTFTGSKGAYDDNQISLYPPRADLTKFNGNDSADAKRFKNDNDLVAVSGATPLNGVLTPLRWYPPADGDYVLYIEASAESDFNLSHDHGFFPDTQHFWERGTKFLGQPSVVYRVPFSVGNEVDVATSGSYAGYSDWNGATGTLHAPDSTIDDTPGHGAGRLYNVSDANGTWRVKVSALSLCDTDAGVGDAGGNCEAPIEPQGLAAKPQSSGTSAEISFRVPSSGAAVDHFEVRYRADQIISDADFVTADPSSMAPPTPGSPGDAMALLLSGLRPDTKYYVAVRGVSACDRDSSVAVVPFTTTQQSFTVLHGCFVATAAFGTPLALEVGNLRKMRDRYLLTNPLGQLVTALYGALSPPLALAIASDARLRAAARSLIRPIATIARALP